LENAIYVFTVKILILEGEVKGNQSHSQQFIHLLTIQTGQLVFISRQESCERTALGTTHTPFQLLLGLLSTSLGTLLTSCLGRFKHS